MSSIRAHLTLLVSALALLASSANSEAQSSPFSTGYLYHFKTDIDDGGEISSNFFHVRAGLPLYTEEGRIIALSGAYHLNAYDFSGGSAGSFASLDPWDNVHTFRLGLPIKWDFGNDWSFFGIPSVRFVGENGADFSDSLSGGALVGFSYRFGDRLTLGPGFGYVSQIEDNASIFPVIILDWKITDALSLTTGPTVGATLGPGLAMNWDISDRWRLSVGARYEKLRFRLDDGSSASPRGVGEDRGIPVFAGLTYQVTDQWHASLLGGVAFGNELRLEDSGGNEILESDYDTAPFLGVNISLNF